MANAKVAISVASMGALDDIHHATLGYNKEGGATLLDFLHPDPQRSIIAKRHGKLLGLLTNFCQPTLWGERR